MVTSNYNFQHTSVSYLTLARALKLPSPETVSAWIFHIRTLINNICTITVNFITTSLIMKNNFVILQPEVKPLYQKSLAYQAQVNQPLYLPICRFIPCIYINNSRPHVGTCEASRFDSNWTISIRFESDGLIRKLNRQTDGLEHAWNNVPSFNNVVEQCSTNHAHCSTKKLQPLRRCNWDLFYVYDFMFM